MADDWKSKVVYDDQSSSSDWKSKVVYDDQSGSKPDHSIEAINKKYNIPSNTFDPKGLLSAVGEQYDKYVDPFTGAPVRAGVAAAQEGKNPIAAWGAQYGKSKFGTPADVPSNEDIAVKAGVPKGKLSKAAGLLLGFGTDPVNLAGFGETSLAEKAAPLIESKIAKPIMNTAQEQAFKGAGGTLTESKKLSKKIGINKMAEEGPLAGERALGQKVLEGDYLKPGDTVKDVSQKANVTKQQTGKALGQIYDTAKNKINEPGFLNTLEEDQLSHLVDTAINPLEFAKDIRKIGEGYASHRGGGAAQNHLNTIADELQSMGPSDDIVKLQEYKSELDKEIPYDKGKPEAEWKQTNKAQKEVRDYLKQKIDARIDAMSGIMDNDMYSKLKSLNKEYGDSSRIAAMSNAKVLKNANRSGNSLGDFISGGAGTIAAGELTHSLPATIAAGVGVPIVRHGIQNYGHGLLAKPLSNLSKAASGVGKINQSQVRAGLLTKGLLLK